MTLLTIFVTVSAAVMLTGLNAPSAIAAPISSAVISGIASPSLQNERQANNNQLQHIERRVLPLSTSHAPARTTTGYQYPVPTTGLYPDAYDPGDEPPMLDDSDSEESAEAMASKGVRTVPTRTDKQLDADFEFLRLKAQGGPVLATSGATSTTRAPRAARTRT